MTGGIVDVGGLYDCLVGIYDGKADDSILEKYSDVRREKYQTMVDPLSTENLLRLFDQNPDTAFENDEFLKLCKRTETDIDLAKEMQLGVNNLKYDFRQHYKSGVTDS